VAGALGILTILMLAGAMAAPAHAQTCVDPRGNLVITGTPSPQPAGSASQVTYSITITNTFGANCNGVTATGVAVTMTLPGGAQFASCTTNPAGQSCVPAAGIVIATFETIGPGSANAARVTLRANMPGVTQTTTLSLQIFAHADNAIGGEEPRDGSFTINSTVLPPATRLMMVPSGRIVPVGCGSTVDSALFGSDTEGQLLDGLVCDNGSGVTITAAGKTLNLLGKKISSSVRITGNAGIIVGPNAPNITIKGGGTAGTMGIEQFEYCVKDLGGNNSLTISGLRCFRAKGAGIWALSNGILIDSSLVDNTVPDTKLEFPGGGVGIQVAGDNVHVKDTIVRRSKNIGFWAYGVDLDGSGSVSTYDGSSTATSRIENNFGIGAFFSGGPHLMKNTQVQGDDSVAGTSQEGIVVDGTGMGVTIDSVVIKKHHGDAVHVHAGAIGTVIARTNAEDIGGDGFVVDAASTVNGNSATLVAGDGFVVNAPAALNTNSVEQGSGNGFVINAAAMVDNNSAVDNAGRGYVLTSTAPAPPPAAPGTGWSVQGLADFNGDGITDILWRSSSGAVVIWLMNGTTLMSAVSLGTVPTDWTIEGVGDFNGDGMPDILWRHASGFLYIWIMNGTSMTAASGSPGNVPIDWTIQAVADFDGDGKADILWRHSSGFLYMWIMNGTSMTAASASPGNVPTDWSVQAVAAFDGDGKADILWRHISGFLYMWIMNGTSMTAASASPGNVAPDWIAQGAGAFNRDGRADILWRLPSGDLSIWFMNGAGVPTTPGGARLRTNTAEGNTLGSFLVTGGGNVLESNRAKSSGGRGFDIAGSGNTLDTNAAERNTGPEFVIGPGNIDDGNNRANGTRFSFSAAGGTFE